MENLVKSFGKDKSCPPSETVLFYVEDAVAPRLQKKVRSHISTCDFCGAEAQLFRKMADQAQKKSRTSPAVRNSFRKVRAYRTQAQAA
jgi:hypothetical protein